MKHKSNLTELKRIAKQIARSKRLKLHEAQNLLAQELGYQQWYELSTSDKMGNHPSPVQMAMALHFLETTNPAFFAGDGPVPTFVGPENDDEFDDHGEIDGHPYVIGVSFDDVFMNGKCWQVHVGEAPLSKPNISVTDRRFKNNPIHDPEFVEKALTIANAKAEQVRARIAFDWPKQSTKPDQNGNVQHPLGNGFSDTWFCMHCDAKLSGGSIRNSVYEGWPMRVSRVIC